MSIRKITPTLISTSDSESVCVCWFWRVTSSQDRLRRTRQADAYFHIELPIKNCLRFFYSLNTKLRRHCWRKSRDFSHRASFIRFVDFSFSSRARMANVSVQMACDIIDSITECHRKTRTQKLIMTLFVLHVIAIVFSITLLLLFSRSFPCYHASLYSSNGLFPLLRKRWRMCDLTRRSWSRSFAEL